MLKNFIKNLPQNPGVYIYKNNQDDIIYIGKAKNLKKRVSSYFNKDHKLSPKTKILVKNIKKIEYIIVDNEVEALLLENKLIKKHKPKYNIDLKDSKTYPYLCITNEEIPKVITTRIIKNNGTYFGPFTDTSLRYELIRILVEIFGLITNKTFSSKSQLNYQIGLSPAKSLKEIDKEKYLKQVKLAINFLKGKNTKEIFNNLKKEMLNASKKQNFELALEFKKKLEKLEFLLEKQKVDLIKNYNQDIITLKTNYIDKTLILILEISKGVIQGKKEFNFDYFEEELLENFLKLYYSKNSCPKEIIIEKEINDNKNIEDFLKNISGFIVKILIPQKGEKLKLLKLAQKNIVEVFSKKDILDEIKKKLFLSQKPVIIECFDMSNLGSEDLVGAMTRWNNKKEEKQGYRKFNIKSFKGKNDDFAAMREVVFRRYLMIKENREKKGISYPNLIIIDGGKGQLNCAIESLKKLRLHGKIDIISIAKGERRNKNEIFLPNKENSLVFNNNSEMILFLRKIRDSVHNYVINFNISKRNQKMRKEFKNID